MNGLLQRLVTFLSRHLWERSLGLGDTSLETLYPFASSLENLYSIKQQVVSAVIGMDTSPVKRVVVGSNPTPSAYMDG